MADNTQVNTMTGGDVISTDDLGTVKVQRVKVQYGVDGSATDVAAGTPLPVTNSGTQAVSAASLPLPTGAATSAQMSDGTQKTQIVDPGGTNVATVDVSGALKIAGNVAVSGSAVNVSTPSAAVFIGANNGTTLKGVQADASGNLRVDLSQTSANATAIKVDGSAVTQPVSGTVSTGLTQPLTDTQLRASAVPVSLSTTAVTQATGTNLHTVVDSGAVTETNSAAILAKLPSQGQAAMAASQPVVIASNQSTIPVSLATAPSTPVTGTFWQTTQPVSLATNTPTIAAGSAIIGKVTTDQTTHGTTDLVAADITKVGGTSVTNALPMQGYQPAATSFTGVIATGALASTAALGYNVATVTLRTFTGTTPSITFKLQASDDNTNWVDIQGINNTTGVVGTTFTQAAALTAGTAGPSIDFTVGAYTNVRINVTAISGASATAAFGLGFQSMPYEASPGAIAQGAGAAGSAIAGNPVRIGGSDGTNTQDINVVAKATQGTRGVATQDLKDSGRSSVMITASVASTATTETLITITKSLALAATGTSGSTTITTGKRFRIQGIFASARNSTGTTAGVATIRLRAAVAGATTTSSPLQFSSSVALPAAATTVNFPTIDIPDGFEIDSNGATNTYGITITHPQWVTASVVATFDISIIGYEY